MTVQLFENESVIYNHKGFLKRNLVTKHQRYLSPVVYLTMQVASANLRAMTNASFLSQNDKVSCAGKGWERALSSGKLDVHGLKNGGFHFNDSMKT